MSQKAIRSPAERSSSSLRSSSAGRRSLQLVRVEERASTLRPGGCVFAEAEPLAAAQGSKAPTVPTDHGEPPVHEGQHVAAPIPRVPVREPDASWAWQAVASDQIQPAAPRQGDAIAVRRPLGIAAPNEPPAPPPV